MKKKTFEVYQDGTPDLVASSENLASALTQAAKYADELRAVLIIEKGSTTSALLLQRIHNVTVALPERAAAAAR